MLNTNRPGFICFMFALITIFPLSIQAEGKGEVVAEIKTGTTYQTMAGFGGALAFYEGWVTAHPNKSQIYDAVFKELSLDILRVRNAYGYDNAMVGIVKEFVQASQNSAGSPIDVMTCSWGPPAYLKSNNDKNNGGTIKYTVSDGKVNFDYAGFASWWKKSLDNYNANGVYPKYVSIQNEPDWKADYESCLLNPNETFTSTDTIAGYNKALYAVYDSIQGRANKPLLIGPETVGIGYNQVENYINAMDVSKIDAISHHLYHDVDSKNPYTCATFSKVGTLHPEIPHMQTEYSLGDWYSLAGLIYKSLYDEKVTAYVYWDLIWPDGGGLVSIDFPWDKNQWKDPLKGYEITKDFYSFKQFSAFIHPGWQRVRSTLATLNVRSVAFLNPQKDTATFVVLNLSDVDSTKVFLSVPGYSIDKSAIYTTSADKNCQLMGSLVDSTLTVEPHSVTTVQMSISLVTGLGDDLKTPAGSSSIEIVPNYPNPFSISTKLGFSLRESQQVWLKVFDYQGKSVDVCPLGFKPVGFNQIDYQRKNQSSGLYFYKVENANGESGSGKFMIRD